jgi:mono/diheme cytochrome c family protein
MESSNFVLKNKSPKRTSSKGWHFSFFISGLVFVLLSFSTTCFGEDLSKVSGDRLAQIAKGGMLYDKWFADFDKEDVPKSTHPAYPKMGKKKGNATWRCKECHGWDYKGKYGHYKKGSHFTGITGLLNMVGVPEEKIIPILKDETHQFGSRISDENMKALAAFVSAGQIEMTKYVNWETYKAVGDMGNGKRIYQTVCSKCHGIDGKKINFGTPEKPVWIGSVAVGNPWESLHKIRMGQPAKEMSSLLAFPIQTQIDVLAYTQILPVK